MGNIGGFSWLPLAVLPKNTLDHKNTAYYIVSWLMVYNSLLTCILSLSGLRWCVSNVLRALALALALALTLARVASRKDSSKRAHRRFPSVPAHKYNIIIQIQVLECENSTIILYGYLYCILRQQVPALFVIVKERET